LNQFIRGIELIIADKFVETKIIKRTVANLLGGNMQIIEDYAKEYAKEYAEKHTKENNENIVIRMFNEGLTKEDIARFTDLDLGFINKTLSK
jgi:DNA-binding NarL/FixJ family response regulator